MTKHADTIIILAGIAMLFCGILGLRGCRSDAGMIQQYPPVWAMAGGASTPTVNNCLVINTNTADEYARMPNLHLTNKFSMSFWLYWVEKPRIGNAWIVGECVSRTTAGNWALYPSTYNKLSCWQPGQDTYFSWTIETQKWYHIAVVNSGPDNTINMYLNATNQALTGGAKTFATSTNMFMLNGEYAGSIRVYYDELAVWSNRVLKASDVTNLYNAGSGLYINPSASFATSGDNIGSNLQALYHFDETPVTNLTLTDSSGCGFTGQVIATGNVHFIPGLIQH